MDKLIPITPLNTPSYSPLEKTLAWSVHLFTASGLLAGFMALLAVQAHNWREAMIWLVVCLVIDGVDGALARLFRVGEILPYMDGKTMDYVIDFATYAIIPAYMFYEAELVPAFWLLPCTGLILMVSVLYYGKTGMVSEDKYFVGFPVMWNMVLFYFLFVFDFSPEVYVLLVVFFAVLHFVPIKFVYPSQNTRFKIPTIINTVIFIGTLLAILFFAPERHPFLIVTAWLTIIYYGGMAVYNTWIEK